MTRDAWKAESPIQIRAEASRDATSARFDAAHASSPLRQEAHGAAVRLTADDMKGAIERNQLQLHYQPAVALDDNRIHSVEALVRWRHPRHGLLLAGQFLPTAEELGLIVPLTEWTLVTALRQCQEWQRIGRGVNMSINLSSGVLETARLDGMVSSALREHDLLAYRLTLEIPEKAVLSASSSAVATLTRLAELRVRLCIDDCTARQSLPDVTRSLFVEAKADHWCVRGLTLSAHDAAVFEAVMEARRKLGLVVVAKGVEDRETWQRLRELGCDAAQGHYLSPALASEAMTRWLHQSGRAMLR